MKAKTTQRKKPPSADVRWFGASGDLRQPTRILALAISKNGRFAATVDDQHVIRVFDVAAGTCRGAVKVPAKSLKKFENISYVSVADDAEHVLAAVDAGFVSGDLTAVKQTLFGYNGSAQMLPDGSGYVQVQGGVVRYLDGSDVKLKSAPFGGDGLDVASDGRIALALWDGEGNRGRLRVLSKSKELASIDLPDCTYMARIGFVDDDTIVCVAQKELVLWWSAPFTKVRSQQLQFEYPHRLLAPLRALIVSTRGPFNIVHLETGKVLHSDAAGLWAVSADGRTLLSAEGSTITRRNPTTFAPSEAPPALRTPIRGVAFDPAGDKLWSVDDEHVHCWNVVDGSVTKTLVAPREPHEWWRGDGERAATVHATGQAESVGPLQRVRTVSRDGGVIIALDGSGFRATAASTGKAKSEWQRSTRVGAMALSPNGGHVVWTDRDGNMIVVNSATGARTAQISNPKGRVVFTLALSPDAQRVATCTDSSTIHVLDVNSDAIVHELKVKRRTTDPVTFSPDGRFVAASDQVVTNVWDAHTGEKHVSLPVGAYSLAFSPDSKQLALGGDGVLGLVAL